MAVPRRPAAILTCLLLLAGCATPLPPPGGPPDRTPPALAETRPPPNAVNVNTNTIELTFTEHVDEASFARAFSLTPDFEQPPTFSWHGRRVEIRLPGPLRPNTTYILTLDNQLKDLHGVALRQPIQLAFSTGPRINRGRLAGQVLEPLRGAGVPGLDVYAYPAPDTLAPPGQPVYRTQTDEAGRFRFEYMSAEPFFVVGLADRNRNRRPDPLEAYAAPPAALLVPDTSGTPAERRWLVAVLDTLPPTLRRVQPRSDRRLALRFSEPVRLVRPDTAGWVVRDSVTAARRAVQAVYRLPDDPFQVMVLTEPLPPTPHTLTAGAVVDTSGNPVRDGRQRFVPAAAPDTFAVRFLGFAPDTAAAGPDGVYRLPPGLLPGVRFNQPLDSTRFRALVAVEDTSGQGVAFTRTTDDGVTYHLTPAAWPPGPFEVRVDARPLGADTVFARRYRRLRPDELGELSGYAVAADTTAPLHVELFAADGRTPLQTTRPDATGYFIFRGLPGGERYRFRAFLDVNGNRRWDGGLIFPYRPAEPLAWSPPLPPVRPRWETVADDTLRVVR